MGVRMGASLRWVALVGHIASMAAALVGSLPLAHRVAPDRLDHVASAIGAALPSIPPTDTWPGPLFGIVVVIVAVLGVPAMLGGAIMAGYAIIRLLFGPVLAVLRREELRAPRSGAMWLAGVLLPWVSAASFIALGTPPGTAALGALVTLGLADTLHLLHQDGRLWVRTLPRVRTRWKSLLRGTALLLAEVTVFGVLYMLLWVSESDLAWLAVEHAIVAVEVYLLWPLYRAGAPIRLFE